MIFAIPFRMRQTIVHKFSFGDFSPSSSHLWRILSYYFTLVSLKAFSSRTGIPSGFPFTILMIRHVPFILYGSAYWQPVLTWMKETGIAKGLIASELLKYVVLVDEVDTAFKWIARACKKN